MRKNEQERRHFPSDTVSYRLEDRISVRTMFAGEQLAEKRRVILARGGTYFFRLE